MERALTLVRTEDAALAAGVQPATIRKWVERGKLRRYGTPRRALYDLAEIARATEPTRRASPRIAKRLDSVSLSHHHNRESA